MISSKTKLDKRIDDMLQYENDDFLLNINLHKDVSDKLLSYQYLHVFNLMSSLRSNNCVLDGSDTGTGKTYTTIAVCKQMRLRPLIICPKTIISKWQQVCDYFGVQPLAIVNYETLKHGKQYDELNDRIDSKLLTVKRNNEETNRMLIGGHIKSKAKTKVTKDDDDITFTWNLPRYSVIVFDEAHRCKNPKSSNGKLLLSTKELKFTKVIMLSATLSDTPSSFHLYGYMLGFYKNIRQGGNWIKGMLREDACYIGTAVKTSAVNRQLYPFKGSRMMISELGDKFPKNQVCAECYNLDKESKNKVNALFSNICGASSVVSSRDDSGRGQILTDLIHVRQELEMLKIPMLVGLIRECQENNFSVVVFVNFNNTLLTLAKMFNTNCLLYGDIKDKDRQQSIKDFQSNKERLIICNIMAGEGISLDDQHGGFPRVSLISPTYSATALIQALGRIHRAGSKSVALQRILYCAGTCEEIVCNRVNEKLKFTATLNDGDLINISQAKK